MKDIQVRIINVTEQRLATIPIEAKLCEYYLQTKKNYEIDITFQLVKRDCTVIKKEWRDIDDGEALFVTFGMMVL